MINYVSGALALRLHCSEKLKKMAKLFAAYLESMKNVDAMKFRGVRMNEVPTVED